MRSRLLVLLAASALAVASVVCLAGTLARAEPRIHSPYHPLTTFAKAMAHVRASYVDDVDETRLVYGAIRGMMHSLDPHSAFMTPDEFRALLSDTEGRFGGIGCEVDVRDGVLTVLAALPDTPAERAGLRQGDRLLAIDGAQTEGMSLQEALVLMRGEPGTRVTLLVRRPGQTDPFEVTLERAMIAVESVEARFLAPGIGYIRLRAFQEDSATRFGAELDRLERESGGHLSGLVIDLRGNPGGLVEQAVEIADEFLAEGVIVTTRGRGGRVVDEIRARQRGTREPFPLVVVVNGYSASASEILVGALQDNARAVIIGTRTYGKGSVQNVIELPDGSGLKLTVARYHTPSGRTIHGHGIEPDIHVEEREPRPAGTELPEGMQTRDGEPDVQLQMAYEHLRGLIRTTRGRSGGGR